MRAPCLSLASASSIGSRSSATTHVLPVGLGEGGGVVTGLAFKVSNYLLTFLPASLA